MIVSHIVNSVFSSKTYVLFQDEEAWLVDCGDIPPLLDMLDSLAVRSCTVKGVLLTHTHYDHIYGLPHLSKIFPDLRVYTNEYGKMALADDRLNYSRYHEDSIRYEMDNVIICKEGTEIDLFRDCKAKLYYTPGHNPSCLTYEICNMLFIGDAFIPGFEVVTLFRGGDKQQAARSSLRISSLAEGRIICPGHETSVNKALQNELF